MVIVNVGLLGKMIIFSGSSFLSRQEEEEHMNTWGCWVICRIPYTYAEIILKYLGLQLTLFEGSKR